MVSGSKYVAKRPDREGFIRYTREEHETWEILIKRQLQLIENRACDEFIAGVQQLGLPLDQIPQIPDLNRRMAEINGWGVEPVPALIELDRFFALLANKRFPAATFIRSRDELDYLQEPDIFHEIFGHCPLLTHQAFADFSEHYGKLGLQANPEERDYLARLYWFTVEFGLLRSSKGLRIYGGGILSSKGETIYALDSDQPQRVDFDALTALRTPYRIDIMQPLYFTLGNLTDLLALCEVDILGLIRQAKRRGDFEPLFPPTGKVARA